MRLVFVHGMRQEGHLVTDLLKAWRDSLYGTWQRLGLAKPDLEPEMPFYGDVLDRLTREIHGEVTAVGRGAPGVALSQTEEAMIREFAGAFGIGAGLTLDEFALWIHLEDVYWSKEGRASIDAVIVATLLGGLVVLGIAPFDASDSASPIGSLVAVVVVDLVFSAIAILKGKPMLGLIGVFIPLASIVGTLRLASPSSPWARRRYPSDGRRMARSQARFKRVRARRRRLMNAIGGAPSQPADG